MKRADTVFRFDPRVHMKLSKDQISKLDKLEELEQYEWFVNVAILVSGNSFGELALINDEVRKATIKCATDCYFATLDKSDYNNILGKIEQKQI